MGRRSRRSHSPSYSPRRDRRRRRSSYDNYDRRDRSSDRRSRRSYDDYDRRDRRRDSRRSRSRERYGSRNARIEKFKPAQFRPRDLSRERATENIDRFEYKLEEPEVAYIFGRQGATKDKLARVSGTEIQLDGSNLKIEGDEASIDRAKKYIQILLEQRNGDVMFDSIDDSADVTFLDIPDDCKGFVTGRRGDTLRQIERECATLMTFCKVKKNSDREPLAIFGTPRGRLAATLKVMSVVEGKHEGYFCKGEKSPNVDISEFDLEEKGADWGVTYMELDPDILGYALGRRGETRMKLEYASDCIIQYIGNWAAFGGADDERQRGKNFLTWLLSQRKSDFKAPETEGRKDVSILYVPESSVGYVTGIKAKTLRNLENKTGTFCFFDRRSGKKTERLLIFGARETNRENAKNEVRSIVSFHQNKIGQRGRVKSEPHSSSSRSRSKGRSKSRSKGRSKSRSKGRSKSRSKSRSRSRSYNSR